VHTHPRTHAHRHGEIYNAYCSSAATVVSWTNHSTTLYVYCHPYVSMIMHHRISYNERNFHNQAAFRLWRSSSFCCVDSIAVVFYSSRVAVAHR
jgi:hypothetical protein